MAKDFERCAICGEPRNAEDMNSCEDCPSDKYGEPREVGECCWEMHADAHWNDPMGAHSS